MSAYGRARLRPSSWFRAAFPAVGCSLVSRSALASSFPSGIPYALQWLLWIAVVVANVLTLVVILLKERPTKGFWIKVWILGATELCLLGLTALSVHGAEYHSSADCYPGAGSHVSHWLLSPSETVSFFQLWIEDNGFGGMASFTATAMLVWGTVALRRSSSQP